jgi:pyruvate ferredoxin oxidoreductase gamma subunit
MCVHNLRFFPPIPKGLYCTCIRITKKEMIELRFIGRGGQGGKTAAYLAAEAAFAEGKDVQAFPEFGPEREGAPVFAYTRISDELIAIHSGVTSPSIVVVIDDTLVCEVDIAEGLVEGGTILINTKELTEELKARIPPNAKVYTVDATGIAQATLGRNIPNMPMLGALSGLSGLFSLKKLESAFRKELGHKLRPELIKSNLLAMEQAHKRVKQVNLA